MLLKSLSLKNIRSYVEQQVEFPSGTLLLAGDIGSGKSTILLAIEFALFGLLRGDVDGSALLRNGSREGFVELTFTLDSKEHVLHRALKRQKERVSQEAGWMQTDGVRKDGTAQELRAWVLDLLGYPKEFLTKSKSMLFRYTVFTPQEEMKRILFEEKDARLETLRRVFNVDKYKRIKENAAIYVRELREERRSLEGQTIDLESKRNALALKREESDAVKERSERVKHALEIARQQTQAQRTVVVQHEESVRNAQRIRTDLSVVQTSVLHQEQTLQRAQADRQRLLSQQETLAKELPASLPPIEHARAAVAQKDAQLAELEKTIRNFHAAIAQISTMKKMSEDLKQKVASISNCPTCLQVVTQEHKNRIAFGEDQKLHEHEKHLTYNTATKEQLETQLVIMRQELQGLRLQEQQALLAHAKQKALADLAQQVAAKAEQITQFHDALEGLRQKKTELISMVEANANTEQAATKAKQALDVLLIEERKYDVDFARLTQDYHSIEKYIASLADELKLKEQAREKLQRIAGVQAWLTDQFSNLMDVMEKHVLSRVHHEFNDLFQRWFGILVEDELLSARLDDAFSPIVVQNGFEVDVSHLSGGEKTACALAYRLALNKVINDVIGSIRTRDVLILDEPTDGFSSEQLDKVRDVLEQLHLGQVILVSHESKIESMVDSVLRVQKDGHVSRIAA